MQEFTRQVAGALWRVRKSEDGTVALAIERDGTTLFDAPLEPSDDADDLEVIAGMVRRMLAPLKPSNGIQQLLAAKTPED